VSGGYVLIVFVQVLILERGDVETWCDSQA
jgi:hypothetical protein